MWRILLFFFFLLVLNCARLLTRVLPYIFEEPDWENIFWSSLPAGKGDPPIPLAHSLCSAICVSNYFYYLIEIGRLCIFVFRIYCFVPISPLHPTVKMAL